jgi:hypothetical protein
MYGNLLAIFHKLFVCFMFCGFLVPEKFLFYFIIIWPCVYLHWQFNDGRCVLTELQYYLDNKPFPPKVYKSNNYPFMRKMLSDININLSNSQLHYAIIYGYTISCLIGVIRYIKYLNK